MAQRRIQLAPHWSDTRFARVLGPMQKFVHRSASSGIVLFVATIAALALANLGFAEEYEAVLESYIGITIGPWELRETVIHWINDGLMAIFFFLVGLEIKREIMVGELATPRAAALPIVAAAGGAIVPALIYVMLNWGSVGVDGWGVPMATDIAFALGCLALLGSRVPFTLKIFLTAVAIVDDLIAVVVIALFYSGTINFVALGIGIGVLCVLLLANIGGIRTTLVYALLGIVVWIAFLQSGVHATIAGVLIALTIPARHRINAKTFSDRAHGLVHHFEQSEAAPSRMLVDETQQSVVLELEELCEDVQAPLQKLEHRLHTGVQFVVMPIFAFANAGVVLSFGNLAGDTSLVALGIVLGLVLGKPLGLLGAAWLATRAGLVALPEGVTWQHMIGASVLAGIGFTMSLFIASLGFNDPALLATAKLAILLASLIAGTVGVLLLSRTPAAPEQRPGESVE